MKLTFTQARRSSWLVRAGIVARLLLPAAALAAPPVDESKLPPPAAAKIDFGRDIKPLFEQSCLRCHGPEKPKSRYRLDNREDAVKGGENGVDILPGDGAKSPLVHFAAGLVEDMEMPPKGKGEPLTAAQIGLLRAWIDQGAIWEPTAPPPAVELVMAPTFGWTTVSGDERKFREHRWTRDGLNGGAERFTLTDRLGKDAKLTLEGRALVDDYKLSLTVEQRELGFTRFGWEQFRKYYDDTGGYHPGFDPATYSLNRDLYLDLGRAWAEVGLTLPQWPRMTLGYEYQHRDGEKSMLQWGPVTQGDVTRNIYPASKVFDERVHIIRFDLDHDLGGFRIEDSFRGEFYDLQTARRNATAYTPGTAAPASADSIREKENYFHGANALRVERQFTRWWLASAGYHYSKLDSEASFSLDTVFPTGPPGFANRWRAPEIVIGRESHTFNATSLLGPWQGITLSAGVLSEWTRQEGFGHADLGQVSPPPSASITNPAAFSSSYDRAAIEESVALRYTTIPFTVLYAEARLQQESVGENEQTTGPYQFLRRTDASTQLRDWRVGFNTSPWHLVSLNGHYRRYEKETDFDDASDSSTGYPAFIHWRGVTTDEVEARLVTSPNRWLKTTLSYKYVNSDYQTATDFIAADVTPGGRQAAANYDAHIYSLNAALTPWRRLRLGTTLSYQATCMTAFANHHPSVAPYRGDLYSALVSASYVVSPATDLHAAYTFSWADYAQNNFNDGLPVGMRYEQHGLTVGLSRRLTRNISTRLQYGFYHYDEPSSAGANNYTAHAIFGTLNVRMP